MAMLAALISPSRHTLSDSGKVGLGSPAYNEIVFSAGVCADVRVDFGVAVLPAPPLPPQPPIKTQATISAVRKNFCLTTQTIQSKCTEEDNEEDHGDGGWASGQGQDLHRR